MLKDIFNNEIFVIIVFIPISIICIIATVKIANFLLNSFFNSKTKKINEKKTAKDLWKIDLDIIDKLL